jgi:diguanylate cyclase (GGDEF)-like protein
MYATARSELALFCSFHSFVENRCGIKTADAGPACGDHKMKKMTLYGMADTSVAENTNTQFPKVPHQESPTITHLQDPFSAQTELKRALVKSQQQLKAAQQQIETLEATNAFLRQRLIRLAKKCAQSRHFAHHDELTGLPNRSLLLDRLKQAMAQSARQQKQVALLFIDLDGFKGINDRLGHAAGDKLLQLVAERLAACVRYGDTVCRYGGDEFVILLPEIEDQESAEVVTEKIREHLAASYEVYGNVIAITLKKSVELDPAK